MICSVNNPVQRRFIFRCWVSGGLVVLFCIFAALVFRLGHPHGILAYLVAALPALPIVWALIATGIYLDEEKDEFQRNMLVQSLLGGTGGILATTTAWGYMEDFAHIPHLDPMWIYPLFWIFAGISYGVVRRRYR